MCSHVGICASHSMGLWPQELVKSELIHIRNMAGLKQTVIVPKTDDDDELTVTNIHTTNGTW